MLFVIGNAKREEQDFLSQTVVFSFFFSQPWNTIGPYLVGRWTQFTPSLSFSQLVILVFIWTTHAVYLTGYVCQNDKDNDGEPFFLKAPYVTVIDWMCLQPPSICMLTPEPPCDAVRSFGRWWGHEGVTLMVGLVPVKDTSESLLIPSTMRGHSKKTAIYEPGSAYSPDTESAGTLILDFQLPELWERNVCCL